MLISLYANELKPQASFWHGQRGSRCCELMFCWSKAVWAHFKRINTLSLFRKVFFGQADKLSWH